MANEEQLKILKQGTEVWIEWRDDNAEMFVDLSDADIRNTELSDANLCGVDLSGTNLSESNLLCADLSIACLSESDLTNANLCRADLSDTDLSKANLSRAIILSADLAKADLRGSNLFSSDLRGSNLTNAKLSRAELVRTEMARVNLTGTDFSYAVLDTAFFCETKFAFTKLKNACGLETCIHYGRSALDYHTLMDSAPLPRVFLRGCGLSEEFIRYLTSFWNVPSEFYSCFISYGHVDKAFARRLHDALQGRGIRCWLDEHQLLPGDQIHRAVDEAVRLWDKVLLCCSEASLQSWWVDKEIQKALMKGTTLEGARPGNAGHHPAEPGRPSLLARMEGEEGLEGAASHVASSRRFHRLGKDNAKFESQFERVVKALRADDAARQKAPPPRL